MFKPIIKYHYRCASQPSAPDHANRGITRAKKSDYVRILETSSLGPQYIMFGCQRHWCSSIKFTAPLLSAPLKGRNIDPLHEAIIPKLKVMKTFPLVKRDSIL